MNKKDLFKQLLPGLLPLFIFIIADEIWGTKIGILVALGVGLLELIFNYIKTKKIEKFILLDTSLLVVFGLISILLHNDIFFKLKPALIEGILAAVLGFSIYGSKNLMLSMSQRYMKNMEITKEAENEMNRNLKYLFYITIVHIGLIIYAAYFMSKEAWAFISGGLFYIIFIVYFAFYYLFQRRKIKNLEWLPVVNEKGEIIGKQTRDICHDGTKQYLHPVVHLHLINEKKEVYLQKRPMHKKVQPGKWDTAVGGHVDYGENIETALLRETKEEIGIKPYKIQFIKSYVWETDIEKELVYMFIGQSSEEPIINKEELEDGKFWSFNSLQKSSKHHFTPNFLHELEILKQILK